MKYPVSRVSAERLKDLKNVQVGRRFILKSLLVRLFIQEGS